MTLPFTSRPACLDGGSDNVFVDVQCEGQQCHSASGRGALADPVAQVEQLPAGDPRPIGEVPPCLVGGEPADQLLERLGSRHHPKGSAADETFRPMPLDLGRNISDNDASQERHPVAQTPIRPTGELTTTITEAVMHNPTQAPPALSTSLQATAAAQWLAKATSETVTAYTDDATDSHLYVLTQGEIDRAWRLMTGQAPCLDPHPLTTAGRLRIAARILDELRRSTVSYQCDANLEGREDVGDQIYRAHQAMSVALANLRQAAKSAGRDRS